MEKKSVGIREIQMNSLSPLIEEILSSGGTAEITVTGNSMYPMLKHRRPDTKACQHYELRPLPRALPDKAFVQRFLTTEFLQYILALDLPENTWWANTPEE